MPPTRDDNISERFARIEALMEEYRLNHEDFEDYVRATRSRAGEVRDESRKAVTNARRSFDQSKNR